MDFWLERNQWEQHTSSKMCSALQQCIDSNICLHSLYCFWIILRSFRGTFVCALWVTFSRFASRTGVPEHMFVIASYPTCCWALQMTGLYESGQLPLLYTIEKAKSQGVSRHRDRMSPITATATRTPTSLVTRLSQSQSFLSLCDACYSYRQTKL